MDFYVVMKRAGDRVSKRKIKTNKVSSAEFTSRSSQKCEGPQGIAESFSDDGFF
jgi:hypothetical protein